MRRGRFLRGIVDPLRQNRDRVGRHLHLHHRIAHQVGILRKADAHLVQPHFRLFELAAAEDDARRPAAAIQIDGLEPALHPGARQHDDRVRMVEWLFEDEEPAGEGEKHEQATDACGGKRTQQSQREAPAPSDSGACHGNLKSGSAEMAGRAPRHPSAERRLALEQANFSGARALAGIFLGELDALAFTKQLEDGAADRAAMEKVLDSPFVANESKTLIDQKASDCPGRHTRVLR